MYNDYEEFGAENSQSDSTNQTEQFQETRSGRRVRPPEHYRDTFHIIVGGMHFAISQMHFTVAATDLSTPSPVYQSEIKVLGIIMTQPSLREG